MLSLFADGMVLARNAAVNHLESDELFDDAFQFSFEQAVAPDEILVQIAGPAQAGFNRRGVCVNFVAVQRHLGFKSQTVARAQANRFHALIFPRLENRVPNVLAVTRRNEQLKAIFAGVPGARDETPLVVDTELARVMILDFREVERFELLQHLFGFGTLECEHVILVGNIGQFDLQPRAMRVHPFEIFFAIRGIDDNHVVRIRAAELVDECIVHDGSIGIAQDRILGLIHFERGKIGGEQVLEKRERVGSGHIELTHVVNVEKAGGVSNGVVFFQDAGILHRHFPAAELDHARAERDVRVVQWSAF